MEDRLRAQIAQLQADLEEIRSRLSSASATRDADAARDAKKEAAEAHRVRRGSCVPCSFSVKTNQREILDNLVVVFQTDVHFHCTLVFVGDKKDIRSTFS